MSAGNKNYADLSAGTLRNVVQIQAQSASGTDAFGQPSATAWATIFTTFGAIRTVTLNEEYQSGQFVSRVTHTIKIRWVPIPTMTSGMRALYQEQNGLATVFQIQTVSNIDRRNMTAELRCLEIAQPVLQ